jgi:hypothetical protein
MSAETTINRLPVPPALLALLETGRWRRPADLEPLQALTGLDDAADLEFCDLASMRRNTAELVAELDRTPELFGLASPGAGDHPASGHLDPHRAIVIAVTHGDGIVVLDYSTQASIPSVAVTDWSSGRARWRTIAPDLTAFATRLGLA